MWNKIGWTLFKPVIAKLFAHIAFGFIVISGIAAVACIFTSFNQKYEDIHQVFNYVFIFGLVGFCFFVVFAAALDEEAIEILPR